MPPSKKKITVLKQVCNLIPGNLVQKLAKKHGVDKQSRSFSPWSHVVSLISAQTTHAMSLNDVCDALKNHSGALLDIRGATPPSRNGFSHANRKRNADMAENLFWDVFSHLKTVDPTFGLGHNYAGIPRRFKRTINAVDSTTIKLFANCMSWAKHRRRKAAAKMHMRLNLQTFLPEFVVVKAASGHDSTEAERLCKDMRAGEIAVFDKAYIKFPFLYELTERDIFFVSRAKDNMDYEVVGQHRAPKGKIKRDEYIKLKGKTATKYPDRLRLIEAEVEIKGKKKLMVFITNTFEWVGNSICDLYKSRWAIELFFKQIKQTLQIADFLGYNENAVRWQIWIAMLTYILLRFIGHASKWTHSSFNRLFTVLRGVLWNYYDMWALLNSYGTASTPIRIRAAPEQAYLPGFSIKEF